MDPETELQGFIDRFDPAIAAIARACRPKVRAWLPNAMELVYDNYSALAIGYGVSEKTPGAIVSIVLYPRLVRFFFLNGARLADPEKRLEGNGSQVRSIKVLDPEVLDDPAVVTLIEAAIDQAAAMSSQPGRTIIKSIAKKQMPRRLRPKTQPR